MSGLSKPWKGYSPVSTKNAKEPKEKTSAEPPPFYEPDADATPKPKAFDAVLPHWAKGGNAWFLLDGSTDRSCQADGEPMELWGTGTIDACGKLCEGLPGCKGMQYDASRSKCSLWTDYFDWTEEDEGTICLSYREGEFAPEVTPEPTPAPTHSPTPAPPPTAAPTRVVNCSNKSSNCSNATSASEDSQDGCGVDMAVHGVDFDRLSEDPGLYEAFGTAIKQGLVSVLEEAAKITLLPRDIHVRLELGGVGTPSMEAPQEARRRLDSGGSVHVHASVSSPADVELAEMLSALGDPASVSESVATAVSAVSGIEAAASGTISVDEVTVQAASTTVADSKPPEATGGPKIPKGVSIPLVVMIAVGVVVALGGVALVAFFCQRRADDPSLLKDPLAQRRSPTKPRLRDSPGASQDARTGLSAFSSRLAQMRQPPPPPQPPPPEPSRFALW